MTSFIRAVYGPHEDYGKLRKKGSNVYTRFLEMIANFRNGEIQSFVALEWQAIRLRPKYHSNWSSRRFGHGLNTILIGVAGDLATA